MALTAGLAGRKRSVVVELLLYHPVVENTRISPLPIVEVVVVVVVVAVVVIVVVVVGVVIPTPRPRVMLGPVPLGLPVVPRWFLLTLLFFSGLKELSPFFLNLGQSVLGPHCSLYTVCDGNRGLIPAIDRHC